MTAARMLEVMLCGAPPGGSWLGVELYLNELERHLSRRQGLRVRTDPACARPPVSGNRLSRLAAKYVRYPGMVARESADVFHIVDHSYGHLVRPLKRRGRCAVVTCHDLYNFERTYEAAGVLNRTFVNRHILGGLRHADRIVALSEATRRDLIRLLGVQDDRIVVNYQGVEEVFRQVPRDEALQAVAETPLAPRVRPGLGKIQRILLHVGGCYPRKNIEGILRSTAALVKHAGLDVVFVKVGEAFTPEQARLIQELGVGDRILHLGLVSPERLVALYNLADVLVFPSFHEGFGRPLVEAMACGLPIVCSNAASVPEVAGDAAVAVDPADTPALAAALRSVLTTPGLTASLRAAGLTRVKQFTWPRHCERLEAVYQDAWKSERS